ncbi:hypothetical protein BDV98DRAFT_595432 [Pterulicium gracile]|uniref:Uncharacterized protein n=1 Tax=Pterulicium gracile TaxID=1884261 RepID=A0A5C3QEB5_9AGAR|nr:hypothetical protein BDV98DRAFT_595432 [Pterula gracilis]
MYKASTRQQLEDILPKLTSVRTLGVFAATGGLAVSGTFQHLQESNLLPRPLAPDTGVWLSPDPSTYPAIFLDTFTAPKLTNLKINITTSTITSIRAGIIASKCNIQVLECTFIMINSGSLSVENLSRDFMDFVAVIPGLKQLTIRGVMITRPNSLDMYNVWLYALPLVDLRDGLERPAILPELQSLSIISPFMPAARLDPIIQLVGTTVKKRQEWGKLRTVDLVADIPQREAYKIVSPFDCEADWLYEALPHMKSSGFSP